MDFEARVRGSILGGAVGDALGAAVEFLGIADIRERFGQDGITDYARVFSRDCAITDDTQMTLFTLDALIRDHVLLRTGGPRDPVGTLHDGYLRWLHTQQQQVPERVLDGWLLDVPELHSLRAPGSTCLSALRNTADGARRGSIEQPLNDSKGCGGVMRAAPFGLLPAPDPAVFRLAAEAAALTHGHPSGYLSAGVLAVLVRRLLHGEGLDAALDAGRAELSRWPGHEEQSTALDTAVALAARGRPSPELIAEQLGGGWVGEEALAISVCCMLVATDFADGLRLAVNHSGDSDSTGAICGNLLGARDGIAAVPAHWVQRLELREVIDTLITDALAEFGPNPPEHAARYPG